MKESFPVSLLALALVAVPAAEAQNCSVSQTKGVYSALATGAFTFFPPPLDSLAGPTTRVGRVDGDGKGNVTIRAVATLNGFLLAEEYSGFLTVNPDCTTNVSFLIPFPGVDGLVPLSFTGLLSDNFKQHDIMAETAFGFPVPSTVTITLRRQDKAHCTNNDLRGGYALQMRGVTGPPGPATPFVRLGRVVFDGAGGFSANTNVTDGTGGLTPEAFTGFYSVNPSCEFTMTYNGGNTWAGVLMDNSSAAHVMVSIPNPPAPPEFPAAFPVVVSGTLKKQ